MCELFDATTIDDLICGEKHYVRGLHATYCARDEEKITKKQAIEFWHTIPIAERKEKYGGLSEFLFQLIDGGYIIE